MPFWICKAPGDPGSVHETREEAVAGIRELFEAGLAERGEFHIVETDDDGKVLCAFDVDDEVAMAGRLRAEPTAFWIAKVPGDPVSVQRTREEAVAGIRELVQAGFAKRGDLYVVQRAADGAVVKVFDIDDEVESWAKAAAQR